jgi:tRNA-dihydrouridine synthase A
MQDKKLVRACLETMQNASDIEVTMKCRIGLGNDLNYDYFSTFIDEIVQSGINIIYVHARNAILNGISPKDNRSIPRLNYEFVKKIKKEHPHVQFILNGGIDSLDKAYALSKEHDGVMLGRLIQNNPFCLGKVDKLFFSFKSEKNLNKKIILDYFNYIKPKIGNDSIFRLLSPLLQIFFGIPDSKKLKTEIHQQIKDQEIDNLESLFLQFINLQKKAILS